MKINLIRTNERPSAFVETEGDLLPFSNTKDAEIYAEREDGEVYYDVYDLSDYYENQHRIEGRDPRQRFGGGTLEDPDEAEEYWAYQYLERAKYIWEDTSYSFALEYDESEFTAEMQKDGTISVVADEDPDFWAEFVCDPETGMNYKWGSKKWDLEANSAAGSAAWDVVED